MAKMRFLRTGYKLQRLSVKQPKKISELQLAKEKMIMGHGGGVRKYKDVLKRREKPKRRTGTGMKIAERNINRHVRK